MTTPRPAACRLLLALVGAPIAAALLVLLAEGCAALLGDPRPRYFTARAPEGGAGELVASDAPPIARTTFRTRRFAARPPAGTRRILCAGDSTCFGYPFDPPVPFPCWIELRLRRLLPGLPIEVVNLGANGFCSRDVLDLLEDVDGGGADVLVVYVGHNEFLDRNLGPLVDPLRDGARRLLGRSRLGALLLRGAGAAPRAAAPEDPAESALVRDAPVLTPEQRERGRRRFGDHLAQIVGAARARGAAVVLVHPVADLRDSPPERSSFSAAAPAAERRRFLDLLAPALELRRGLEEAAGRGEGVEPARLREAFEQLDRLAAIDSGVALLHYERGRLHLLADDPAAARRELEAALDGDGHPLRATGAIHAAIDGVAAAGGAVVADPRRGIDAEAAPGIPGQDGWFVDYCHPDLRGHEAIAEAVLRALAGADLLAPRAEWRFGDEPTRDEYRRVAGYDASRQAASMARAALFVLAQRGFRPGAAATLASVEERLAICVRLSPDCAPAFAGLGMIRALRRETEAALRDFARAAELDPEAIEAVVEAYQSNPAVREVLDAAGIGAVGGRMRRRE